MNTFANGSQAPPTCHGQGHDDAIDFDAAIFEEPEGFRPKTPPPTTAKYTLRAGAVAQDASEQHVQLSLVGSHPLWGHHLWNAAPTLSDYLADSAQTARRDDSRANGPISCAGKSVLELGAAAGLPSIVAFLLGAQVVVSTDYPDPDLVGNLAENLERHANESLAGQMHAEGYIWGANTRSLLRHLSPGKTYYDIVLMSDLIFNHQAHHAMLDTLDHCLPPACSHTDQRDGGGDVHAHAAAPYSGPQALVFFTHHRPHLAHRDVEFFATARAQGWIAEEVGRWTMAPMFPDDPGSAEVRATVHGWRLRR